MKRTLTLALGLVIGASFATQAFAQDAFPDTPENHWAYEALAKMKAAGLLTGYPDGYYRGSRPASRYEMAVALHALWMHLKGLMDGYDTRIKALEGTDPQDLSGIRKMLDDMKAEMAGMKAWGDDIATLKKMAATFEKELASMGVDIEALKKSVSDLADRVSKLEKRKPAVDIHGDVGMWAWGGYASDGNYGITVDGRPTGVNRTSGNTSSVDDDYGMLEEGHLAFTGTNDTGPKWKAVVAIGNMLDGSLSSFDGFGPSRAFGNQSQTATGSPFNDDDDMSIYLQEFSAMWDFNVGGQAASAKMGRQGMDQGSFFLRRPDVTPYYHNQYWDNHEWMFDGGKVGFNFGSTSLNLWAGRVGNQQTNNGDTIQSMYAGATQHPFYPGGIGGSDGVSGERPRGLNTGEMFVESMFGASLGIKLSDSGSLNLKWIQLDNSQEIGFDGLASLGNRVNVFGGELGLNLGSWMLNAGYSQSNLNVDDTVLNDDDNSALWASLSTKNDKWGFEVGGRQIEPLFAAPGDWGRLGIWWNPTDIEGFYAKAHFAVNDNLMLHGSAELYRGSETDVAGVIGLTGDDKVSSYKLDLVYNLSENVDFWVGAEIVKWELADRLIPGDGTSFIGGDVDERWYNVGFRYNMSDSAWWSVRWQISDYDSNGVVGMDPFGNLGSEVAKGGLITTTLGIKF